MRALLDTNAVLYLLGGRVDVPLEAGEYYVSVISEMELLSYPGLTPEAETQIWSFLSTITLVDLTREVKEMAIQLRREHGLRLPDAIVAASAVVSGVEVLTNDFHLLRLPTVSGRSLPLKPQE